MGTVGDLESFVEKCWETIFAEADNAAVYIDHPAAECLHWYSAGKGYVTLKDAGAIAVHELDMYNFRYVRVKGATKAVIVATSTDAAFYRRTIKMIVEKNMFDSCWIFCGARSYSIDYSGNVSAEDKLDYAKLKRDVKDWMNSKSLPQEPTVNIAFVPLFVASIGENMFVTPPFANSMPSLDGGTTTDDSIRELDRLADSLHGMLESLNAKAEVYSVGRTSGRVAEKLESLVDDATSRKNHSGNEPTERGVSLILLDRTLDLCTPTSNNMESFLARILRIMPRLPRHDNDVAIDMSPILGRVQGALGPHEIPGCLASLRKSTIDTLISKKPRKVLTTVNQVLNDMLSAVESPKARMSTRISGHTLEKLLGKIRSIENFNITADSSEKIQTITAVVEASISEKTAQLELLTSLEKLALENLSVSRESSSILAQLSNIIRTRVARGLAIENLLALLIHVYALAGTEIQFSSQQEQRLEESIAAAFFEDAETFRRNPSAGKNTTYRKTLLLLGIDDEDAAKETSTKLARHVVNTLRTIAVQRGALQDYRSLIKKPRSFEMARRVGILEQLATDLLRAETSHEFRDLHQKSPSFISAGFNLFLRGRAKRHPCDNPWILIYVVGGITAEEAKTLRELTATHESERRITLAGSRLLNPLDVSDNILLSSINNQSFK